MENWLQYTQVCTPKCTEKIIGFDKNIQLIIF